MKNMQHLTSFKRFLELEEKSKNTVEKYIRDVKKLLERTEIIDKDSVLDFKKYLIESEYAPRSVNSMIASVNKFLRFIGKEDYCLKSLKLQRSVYEKESRILTKTDYKALITNSADNKTINLIMQTIGGTGIRVSELQYFTVESVKQEEIRISLKGKTRTILITRKLKKKLLKYAKEKNIRSGCIFINRKGKPLHRSYIWALMKKLCQKARITRSKVFPHNFRKLFARTFYKIDKDLAKLADILGHSNINTTRLYIVRSSEEHIMQLELLELIT